MAKKKNSAKQLVQVNIDELKDFIKHIVNNNRYLQTTGKVPVTVNVEGDAGLGKTSAIMQVANELELNCVRLNLAEIEELGDLVGYPVRQFQLCKQGTTVSTSSAKVPVYENKVIQKQVLENGKIVMKSITESVQTGWKNEEVAIPQSDGECLWIDEQATTEYIKRGYEFTGEKRMSYCPPEWITGLSGGGFLILDDYTRADQRFIQACMTLIETQKYISWALPQDWHIILTTNPDNGDYLVTSMDEAQKTRFISVMLKFDVDVWARWAESTGIDGRCINFMLLHPELVTESINARSITIFYNCISSIPDFANNLPLIQMIGEGSVGSEFATLFTLFINNKLDKLISPKEILFSDDETKVMRDLRNCIGTGPDYRADIASILVTRVINQALIFAENNTVEQKTINRLITLTTKDDTLTDDLKYVLIKKILNTNKQKFQKLMVNPEVVKISVKQ